MNHRILLSFVMAFFFIALANVKATEYSTTDGYGWLKYPSNAFSTPLDPRIACEPNNNHCLMLVYENNTFYGRGVKMKYTTDNFFSGYLTTEVGSYSVDYSLFSLRSASGIQLHYPYDVIYDSSIQKYKIIIGNGESVQRYYYSISNGLVNNGTRTTDAPIGFVNVSHYIALRTEYQNPTTYIKSGIVRWDTDSLTELKSVTTGNCGGGGAAIDKASGFVASTISNYIYYGSGVGCALTDINNFPTFPTTYTGLDYFEGSTLGYQNFNNQSWKSYSSDLSTFTGTTNYYEWSSETINNTDTAITTKNQLWVYARYNSASDGIWIYSLPITPITIWGEGCDPYARSCTNVNLSVILNCSSQTYYETKSGQFVDVSTPCQTDNIIVVTASDPYYPVSYSFLNFSIPTNCLQKNNYIRTTASKGYLKSYNFTIKFKDKFFGNDVAGAKHNFERRNLTTNSAGEASFNVFPIDSPSFIAEDFDAYSCTQAVTFTGSPKQNSLIASKSGYSTATDSFAIARSPFSIETDFDTYKTEYLEPTNTQIEVFVYSKDGVELHPSRVMINVTSGSNDTYYINSNVWFHQSYGTKAPAKFYLFNNTGTYNITVALDYFQTYTKTVTVTTSEYQAIRFYLDKNSDELPCYSNADCQPSLCNGQFYKEFSGCELNVCSYKTTDCGSAPYCDERNGCVDVLGVTNCTTDNDCNNTCADANRMIIGLCGADGYCKGKYADCLQGCNSTLAFCEEYRNCLYPQSKEFRAGYTDQAGEWTGGTVTEVTCTLERYKTHFCIIQNPFNITEEEIRQFGWTNYDNIIISPQGWQGSLISNGNAQYIGWFGYDLELQAVSGYCDDYCNLIWEFCKNGCDVNTGTCKGISGGNVVQPSVTGGFWEWYNSVIPDLMSRSILWLIYGIIIIIAIWGLMMKLTPKKANIHLYGIVGNLRHRSACMDIARIVIRSIPLVYLACRCRHCSCLYRKLGEQA